MCGILTNVDILLLFFIFVFGLLVGSFLNVLSLRFGFTESRRPRSACTACEETLRWYELIPVFSYLFLRGQCRTCGSAISVQYPLLELSLGVLFVLALRASLPLAFPFGALSFLTLLFFLSVLALIVVYDIRHTLVPLPFSIALIAAATSVRLVDAFVLGSAAPLHDAAFGALALGGFIAAVVAVTRGRGMGVGDIYVAVALGILFGVSRGIDVMTLAFWLGALGGLSLIAGSMLRRSGVRGATGGVPSYTMKSEVPFVPFLGAAALIGLFSAFSPLAFVAAIL